MCLFYVGFKRLCWWWWLGCLLPGWKRKSSGGRAGRPGGCRLMDLGGSSDEEDGAKVQKKPSKYSLLYFLRYRDRSFVAFVNVVACRWHRGICWSGSRGPWLLQAGRSLIGSRGGTQQSDIRSPIVLSHGTMGGSVAWGLTAWCTRRLGRVGLESGRRFGARTCKFRDSGGGADYRRRLLSRATKGWVCTRVAAIWESSCRRVFRAVGERRERGGEKREEKKRAG